MTNRYLIDSILGFLVDISEKIHAHDDCGKPRTFKSIGGCIFLIVLIVPVAMFMLYDGIFIEDSVYGKIVLIFFGAILGCYVVGVARDMSSKVVLYQDRLLIVGAWRPLRCTTFWQTVKLSIKNIYPYGELDVELPWRDIKSIDCEHRILTITTRSGEEFAFSVNNYDMRIVADIKHYWKRHGRTIKRR